MARAPTGAMSASRRRIVQRWPGAYHGAGDCEVGGIWSPDQEPGSQWTPFLASSESSGSVGAGRGLG